MGTQEFVVEGRGIGKPDYSKEVSLGQVRPGLSLKYGESLVKLDATRMKEDSPFAWVRGVLGVGESAHFVDAETGADCPITIPAGYVVDWISGKFSFNVDARVLVQLDGYPMDILGYQSSGMWTYESDVVKLSTGLFDPLGESEHLFDFILSNEGGGSMQGGATFFGILKRVGSPPRPTTKVVRCKFCGHEVEVPRATTTWTCPACHKVLIFYDLTMYRG